MKDNERRAMEAKEEDDDDDVRHVQISPRTIKSRETWTNRFIVIGPTNDTQSQQLLQETKLLALLERGIKRKKKRPLVA